MTSKKQIDKEVIEDIVPVDNLVSNKQSSSDVKKANDKIFETKKEKYIASFLFNKTISSKSTTYLDTNLLEKIRIILTNSGYSKVSITSYINNILEDHFEKNKEILTRMCEEHFKKII